MHKPGRRGSVAAACGPRPSGVRPDAAQGGRRRRAKGHQRDLRLVTAASGRKPVAENERAPCVHSCSRMGPRRGFLWRPQRGVIASSSGLDRAARRTGQDVADRFLLHSVPRETSRREANPTFGEPSSGSRRRAIKTGFPLDLRVLIRCAFEYCIRQQGLSSTAAVVLTTFTAFPLRQFRSEDCES